MLTLTSHPGRSELPVESGSIAGRGHPWRRCCKPRTEPLDLEVGDLALGCDRRGEARRAESKTGPLILFASSHCWAGARPRFQTKVSVYLARSPELHGLKGNYPRFAEHKPRIVVAWLLLLTPCSNKFFGSGGTSSGPFFVPRRACPGGGYEIGRARRPREPSGGIVEECEAARGSVLR